MVLVHCTSLPETFIPSLGSFGHTVTNLRSGQGKATHCDQNKNVMGNQKYSYIKLMKGKALRKHSLHVKTAASVLLKLFISSNE